MKAHILSLHTPSTCGTGKISECGHVAYQNKENEVKTNIEAKRLTLHTPLTSGSH